MTTGYEQKEFDDLFRQYYPRLTAYACLLVEREAAEDITQDIFEHLWENWGKIYFHTSMESYLFKSVYNRCINNLKRNKFMDRFRIKTEEDIRKRGEINYYNPDNNDIIKELYIKDIRTEIDKAVNKLPKRMKRIFELSYVEEMNDKEIAELVGISNRTVEKHISLALKKLKVFLGNASLSFLW